MVGFWGNMTMIDDAESEMHPSNSTQTWNMGSPSCKLIRLAEAVNFALVSNDLLFPSWDRLMHQKSSKCSKVALPCFLARCHPMRGCQTPQIGIRLPLFLVSWNALRITDMEGTSDVEKNAREMTAEVGFAAPRFPWLQPLFHFLRWCQHPNHPRPVETHTEGTYVMRVRANDIDSCWRWFYHPSVIKHGNRKSPLHGGCNGKIIYKLAIFHCHHW